MSHDYIIVHRWAMDIYGLSFTEAAVLSLICDFSRDNESTFCGGKEYISEWVQISKRSVERIIAHLTRLNLITKCKVRKDDNLLLAYRASDSLIEKLYRKSDKLAKTDEDEATNWRKLTDVNIEGATNWRKLTEINDNLAKINIEKGEIDKRREKENNNKEKEEENINTSNNINISNNNIIKEKENTAKEKENKPTRFNKPTVEEVRDYCQKRKNGIEAELFIDYYESVGWKVGNKSMKDWKACVRTWERNNKQTSKTNNDEDRYIQTTRVCTTDYSDVQETDFGI